MQQQRADPGAEQVAEAAVQAREDQVQRPEQLVRQRGPRQDPAAPQPGPDQLLDQSGAALLWRAPAAADQQVHDRGRVPQVGLQPPCPLLGPCRLHVRRVQLDDVMAGHHQTGHDRAVVVPGSLDPDAHRLCRPLLNSRCQLPLERDRPGLGQRERQGLPDKLPAVISDQAQGRVLTYRRRCPPPGTGTPPTPASSPRTAAALPHR
jgi:hypothetical protein